MSRSTEQIFPASIDGCKEEYRKICKELPRLEREAVQHRRKEQEARIREREEAGAHVSAQVVKRIMIAEEIKAMFR